MNISLLKDEIDSDPAGIGYASHISTGDMVSVADLINKKDFTMVQPISKPKLMIWAAATGVRAKVESHVGDANVGSICLTIKDMLTGSGADTLDMTNPLISASGGMLDALSSIGVLAADGPGSKADLVTLATVPASRADIVLGFGTGVGHTEISQALSLGV